MTTIAVRPIRTSADIPAMARFLECLGLARVGEPGPDGGVDLVGASGVVALRPPADGVPAGTTTLSAEVADLDAFVAGLRAADVEVEVVEAGTGRTALVTDPRGSRLRVEEVPSVSTVRPHGDVHVLPMVFVADHEEDKAFFEAWGLTVQGVERPGHVNLGAPDAGGAIAVHVPVEGRQPVPEVPGATQLTGATTTPLAELAERLEAGGFTTTMHHTPRGDRLGVVDPDGQVVKIHPR